MVEFSPDPLSDSSPTYQDITNDVRSVRWWAGRDSDLGDPQPGGMELVLANRDRLYDPGNPSSIFTDILHRFRLSVDDGGGEGIEFWGDFEQGADGTAPEWTVLNGFLECLAGAEARQLQFVATPTPRLGARIGRFEVASGDKFGATTGERCEVRRGGTNGGFGTGDLEGQIVATQFSTRFLAPWTMPSGWCIFQQIHDAGSTYGQSIFRVQVNVSTSMFEFRAVTGNYPTSGDATAGTNSSTNKAHTMRAFATNQWWDFRHMIYYTQGQNGWYIAEMKRSDESDWVRYANVGNVQTLPSIGGAPSSTAMFDKVGFYRNDQAITNVVFQDGYQVGHRFEDVGYSGQVLDPAWDQTDWLGKPNIVQLQDGNPEFDVDIVGTTSAGGGVTTRTWDTTRTHSSDASLKMVTDGAASGQGTFHTKRSGTRFDASAGSQYTASAWFSGDGGETVRVGVEFFDGASASLGTTFSVPRALRTDFRRQTVTVTAPANTVTARIRTGLSGTAAATFWVDDVALWPGTYGAPYAQGVWYATDYSIGYPDPSLSYSEVTVSCVDGFELLSLDNLESLDPPEASSYEEVVDYDQPSFYYRLGEPEGTKLVSHVRRKKRHGKVVSKRKWKTRETRAEVEGVSGPSGTYKSLPALGEPGLILGDPATSVRFAAASQNWARIGPLDAGDFGRNAVSVEMWTKLASIHATQERVPVSGPDVAGSPGTPIFKLALDPTASGGDFYFQVSETGGSNIFVDSGIIVSAGPIYHVVGTWSGHVLRIYINGALANEKLSSKIMEDPAQDGYLLLSIGAVDAYDGWMQDVAVYEKALEPDTILDHYTAGSARGFASEAAGSRIFAIATSPLWDESRIQTTGLTVQPQMKFGQARLDEIRAAVASEAPHNHFYFDGRGNPVYLGNDHYSGKGVMATFADDEAFAGYQAIEIDFDNEVYNTIITSVDGGLAQTAVDSSSVSTKRQRINDAYTGLTLQADADAAMIGRGLLDEFKEPVMRPVSIGCNGARVLDRAQILTLQIGDLAHVTRHIGDDPIFRVASVLGYEKQIDTSKHLTAKFTLGRGFDPSVMHLGIEGFSELGSTFVLA